MSKTGDLLAERGSGLSLGEMSEKPARSGCPGRQKDRCLMFMRLSLIPGLIAPEGEFHVFGQLYGKLGHLR